MMAFLVKVTSQRMRQNSLRYTKVRSGHLPISNQGKKKVQKLYQIQCLPMCWTLNQALGRKILMRPGPCPQGAHCFAILPLFPFFPCPFFLLFYLCLTPNSSFQKHCVIMMVISISQSFIVLWTSSKKIIKNTKYQLRITQKKPFSNYLPWEEILYLY